VLWASTEADGRTQVRVRLSVDPTVNSPLGQQAEETLTIGAAEGSAPPKVVKISSGQFAAAAAGPQLVRVGSDDRAGTVTVTFDSDLDPATVGSAITLIAAGNRTVDATTSYDAATRTVTLHAHSGAGRVLLRITAALRDGDGKALATGTTIEVPQNLGG
jgi:hypothetical protein